MKAGRSFAAIAALVVSLAAAGEEPRDLWLEDSTRADTQAWVAARNAESERRLREDPRFERERRRFLSLAGGSRSEDYLNGGLLHRVEASARRPLGVWKVMAVSAAAQAMLGKGWHEMVDLDALARREGVRWTLPLWWQNPICDTSLGPRCVLNLSPDGGDRTVLREFDLRRRSFVADGFRIDTPARTYAHWIDSGRLLLSSDFGPGSLSEAGYARQARVWQRGTPHGAARLLFEAPDDAVLYIPHNFRHRGEAFFVAEVWHRSAGAPSWWLLRPDEQLSPGRPKTVAAPRVTKGPFQVLGGRSEATWGRTYKEVERFEPPVELVRYRGLAGIVDDRLVAMTARPLARGGVVWPGGSLLALPLPGRTDKIEAVFVPGPNEAVDAVFHLAVAEDALWFGVMRDVSGRLFRTHRAAGRWARTELPVPEHGAVRLLVGEDAPSAALVKSESILSPPRTLLHGADGGRTVLRPAAAFDATRFVTEQRFATARDGTRIPYYLTRRRGQVTDASAPALLAAYGGFGVSFLPTYLNAEFHSDLAWPMLEHGGLFVHVNVRGGGEYGPAWHRAGQRRDHANSVDDLIAVADDLVRLRWVDPGRLGVVGASNGGLVAAAAAVRRPELFRAVVADVPLTDMLRFHELFTGSVWIDEYGDPRDPGDRAALAAWSPLHQLRAGVRYPEMLITTSSSDDRVHPGHARRFAERLRQLGQPVLFDESTDTGHGAAAALDAAAKRRALKAVYLLQALKMEDAPAKAAVRGRDRLSR